jgi:hypothetical protein
MMIAICSCGMAAQVLQLAGGTSTLYESQGGSISFYSPNYNAKLGIGIVNGQYGAGATLNKVTKDATYTLGDEYVGLSLPTDIFTSSHYLLMTGAGVKTTRLNSDIVAFGGMSATYMGSSLFDGMRAEKPAAIVAINHKVDDVWSTTTDVLMTQRMTLLQGVQWSPTIDTRIAAAAGIGANQPYGSMSGLIHRRLIDVKAAYIQAGNQFHVIGLESQYAAEPYRENLLVTVRPFKNLSVGAGRQNFLVPAYQSLVASSSQMNQVSANYTGDKVHLSAQEVQSKYGDKVNNSSVLMAERAFEPFKTTIQGTYIQSQTPGFQATKMFLLTAKETMSPRWGLNQTLNVLNGNPTINCGGSFLSNILAASVNYETFYVPANITSPFQQSIVVTAQSTLFGRLRLHGNTFVDQLGHIRYTADASIIASRAGAKPTHLSLGKYVIHGKVVDTKGNGVEGAAILFDQMPVFTDSTGAFLVREHLARTHRLTVLGDQFLDVYHYDVVSAPETVTSTIVEDDAGVTIVVKSTVKKNFCVHLCDIGPQSHNIPPPMKSPVLTGPQSLLLPPPVELLHDIFPILAEARNAVPQISGTPFIEPQTLNVKPPALPPTDSPVGPETLNLLPAPAIPGTAAIGPQTLNVPPPTTAPVAIGPQTLNVVPPPPAPDSRPGGTS